MPSGFSISPDFGAAAPDVIGAQYWNSYRVCTDTTCYVRCRALGSNSAMAPRRLLLAADGVFGSDRLSDGRPQSTMAAPATRLR